MTLTRAKIPSKLIILPSLSHQCESLKLSGPFSQRIFSLRGSETAETERVKEREKPQLNAILGAAFAKRKKAHDEINKEKCDMMCVRDFRQKPDPF